MAAILVCFCADASQKSGEPFYSNSVLMNTYPVGCSVKALCLLRLVVADDTCSAVHIDFTEVCFY